MSARWFFKKKNEEILNKKYINSLGAAKMMMAAVINS